MIDRSITKRDFYLVRKHVLTLKQRNELYKMSGYTTIRGISSIKPQNDADNSLIPLKVELAVFQLFNNSEWNELVKISNAVQKKREELEKLYDDENKIRQKCYEYLLHLRKQNYPIFDEYREADINTIKKEWPDAISVLYKALPLSKNLKTGLLNIIKEYVNSHIEER